MVAGPPPAPLGPTAAEEEAEMDVAWVAVVELEQVESCRRRRLMLLLLTQLPPPPRRLLLLRECWALPPPTLSPAAEALQESDWLAAAAA